MQPNPMENASPIFEHQARKDASEQLSLDQQLLLGKGELLTPGKVRGFLAWYHVIAIAAVGAWLAFVFVARVFLYDASSGTFTSLGWLAVYAGAAVAAVVAILLAYRFGSQ